MKDYVTNILDGLIKKGAKGITPTIKYALKKNVISDLLIASSNTFNAVVLDVNNSLSYNPVDANSIVVYKESTTTFYQRYNDWVCDAQDGTIKFLSSGNIEAGDNIVVEYKYYSVASSITASQILTLLKTVDGADSGLDTDLLDGKEGSYYTEYADTKKILSQFVLVKKGDLETGTDVSPAPIPAYCSGKIKEVYVYVKTVSAGSSIIVDVNKNGTTIFTTQSKRPEISAGNHSDTSDEPDVTSFVKNDLFTFDIDQVGSTTAGADIIVLIRFEQVVS